MNEMLQKWREVLNKPSENLTTNQAMPQHLIDKLLEEDETLSKKLKIEDIEFPIKKYEFYNRILGL